MQPLFGPADRAPESVSARFPAEPPSAEHHDAATGVRPRSLWGLLLHVGVSIPTTRASRVLMEV